MVGGVLVGRCRRKSERHRLIGQPGAVPSVESGVEPDQRSAAPSEKCRVKPGGSRQLSATPLRRRNRPGKFDMVAPPGLSNFCSALLQNCPAMARAVASLSKLHTAAGRASKALDAYRAEDPATAFYYLDRLFGGNFPARLNEVQ